MLPYYRGFAVGFVYLVYVCILVYFYVLPLCLLFALGALCWLYAGGAGVHFLLLLNYCVVVFLSSFRENRNVV